MALWTHTQKYALRVDRTIEGRLVNIGQKFDPTAMGFHQQCLAAYGTLRYQPK
jgi:hypothetical protein